MRIFLACTAVLVTMASCTQKERQPSDTEFRETFQRIHSQAWEHHTGFDLLSEVCTNIGHRLTGTPNGTAAEQFAFDAFQSFGFEDVRFQSFPVFCWTRDSATATFLAGTQSWNPRVVSLANTPLETSIQGTLIDVGAGLHSDFEKIGDLKGAIAVLRLQLMPGDTNSLNLHRSEKVALASKHGATGVIFLNMVEGNVVLTGTASVSDSLTTIPAISMGMADASQLLALMAKGRVVAEINVHNHMLLSQGRNVIATLPGSDLAEQSLVIGGHLDSWDLATGAIDNGIGSFSILEIARIFKALNITPRRTIHFIAFMGEENGLLGSTAYVDSLVNSGMDKHTVLMINKDMAANDIGFNAGGSDSLLTLFANITPWIAALDTHFKGKHQNSAGLHSDHQPFMLHGIPTVSITSDLDPVVYRFYHATGDSLGLVRKEWMQRGAANTGMLLYYLSMLDRLPIHQLSSDESRDFLIKHGLREKLELHGEWKWHD